MEHPKISHLGQWGSHHIESGFNLKMYFGLENNIETFVLCVRVYK